MFKNIVVALNGSACALHAFDLAMALAKVEGSNVVICNVVDPMSAMWGASSNPSGELALAHAKTEAERLISEAVTRARGAGLLAEGRLLSGDPADEIVACAVGTSADAIVMGTHGWSGLKHFVMGSVAESVLRSAPCPVVVVRDQARVPSLSEEAAS
jgi:nucleotide-binding universal stress UspA family protein